MSKTNKIGAAKELFIKITRIPNNDKGAIKSKEQEKECLKSPNNPEKPVRNVHFNVEKTKSIQSHNLRNLEIINYAEESIIDATNNSDKEKPKDNPLNRKDHLPIYRNNMVVKPKSNKQNDVYEFTDVSPKPKKIIKIGGSRKSSILFDKNTHKILKKIEEQETRAKKKCDRKQYKVPKPLPTKTYNKKMEKIMSNIRQKISKKNKANTNLTTEKRHEKQNSCNENLTVQNSLNNNLQGQKDMPLNDSYIKVIRVNSFNDEMSIIVHQSATVPSNKLLPQNYRDICVEGQENVPLNDSHTKMMQLSNCKDKTSIKVYHSAKVPLRKEIEVLQKQNCAKNITSTKVRNLVILLENNAVVNKENLTNTFDKLKKSVVATITTTALPKSLDSISLSNSDNGSVQDDIDSCFGFKDDMLPARSTSNNVTTRRAVNILGNVVTRHGAQNVESPVDFNVRRPNANSTMIHIGTQNRNSSPWRPDCVNVRPNPHFVSVKSNALPRIDQEPVFVHTLVEEFENLCSKAPKKGKETPAKKLPVQQSILDFVDSNIEIENEPFRVSLYDYEAFNSPVKNNRKEKENQRVEKVRKHLLGNKDNIVSSTPIKRRVLGDISNSSGEQLFPSSSPEENSYFGFNETLLPQSTPEKRRNKDQNRLENPETHTVAKPSRFDMAVLRSYSAKDRKKKKVSSAETEEIQVPEKSISLVELSTEENSDEEVHLFEEPLEELLDENSSVHITEKKHRRKRLDSCNSGTGELEKKRKRHKKTKLEIEQENWIEQFNQMCDEVDQHELELE